MGSPWRGLRYVPDSRRRRGLSLLDSGGAEVLPAVDPGRPCVAAFACDSGLPDSARVGHGGAEAVGVMRSHGAPVVPGDGRVRVAVLAPDRGSVGGGERFGLGGSLGDCVAALHVGVDGGEQVAGFGVCEGGEVHGRSF